MREFLKKSLILFFIFTLTFSPVLAKDDLKIFGKIHHDFSTQNIPEIVYIKTDVDNALPDGLIIPAGSKVGFEIMQVQRERRWHKSGYILCKLKDYTLENEDEVVDLSDKNIYLAIRKHEPIEGREAIILTTEIVITQAAGIVGSCFIFFAPVDIAYFFTRGVIRREKHHNWFKAGVHDAYDNSICWFWLKGKPIELNKTQSVKIQGLSEKKALKLEKQIAKRNHKQMIKDEKKALKLEAKAEKLQAKYEKEKAKNPEKFERKMAKKQLKKEKYEARVAHEKEVQKAILEKRALKKKQKHELRQAKKEQKLARKAEKKAAKEAKKLKQEAI